MAGKVNWHGDRVRRQIEAEMGRRLKACGQVGKDHAKTLVSVDGTAKRSGGSRDSKGRFLKGLIYNVNPSKPGEPPHVQTGRLRASVAYEVDGQVARIGTNVIYARHLELGTSRMAARPWLRRMLVEMTPTFRAILTAPIKGGR